MVLATVVVTAEDQHQNNHGSTTEVNENTIPESASANINDGDEN